MKLKLIAAAALVVSVGAHADMTFNLGTISTSPIGNAVSGLFTDTYNFDSVGSSTVTAIAVTTSYLAGGTFTLSNIASFTGMLDSTSLIPSTPVITPTGVPGLDRVMQELTLTSLPIAAGPHTLSISGFADTGSSYTGSITVTAVPEPETYALMLAGLGAIGFLARRRQQR